MENKTEWNEKTEMRATEFLPGYWQSTQNILVLLFSVGLNGRYMIYWFEKKKFAAFCILYIYIYIIRGKLVRRR